MGGPAVLRVGETELREDSLRMLVYFLPGFPDLLPDMEAGHNFIM
jgi:hypothetical protein